MLEKLRWRISSEVAGVDGGESSAVRAQRRSLEECARGKNSEPFAVGLLGQNRDCNGNFEKSNMK